MVDHPFVQRLRESDSSASRTSRSPAPLTRYNHSSASCTWRVAHMTPASGTSRSYVRRGAPIATASGSLRSATTSGTPLLPAAEPPCLLRELGITCYDPELVAHRIDERATHEDYTIAILTRSSLADTIRANFSFTPEHVARLVSHEVAIEDDFFVYDGYDLRYLLSQLISSDLDADRLDYLVRDSYFTGARYGQTDVNWLISHMGRYVDQDGRVSLSLDRRALYAFDDFMIARFHMFVMVYFHQKSVAYEEMLKLYMQSGVCDYRLPADLTAYRKTDDAHLMAHLRGSQDDWAGDRGFDPIKVVFESVGVGAEQKLNEANAASQRQASRVRCARARGGLRSTKAGCRPSTWSIVRTIWATSNPSMRPQGSPSGIRMSAA